MDAARFRSFEKAQLCADVRGQGFPILCLHGHPGSAASMSVFTEHLSLGFLTLAPDLRGYGRSIAKRDFEMSDHLLDLEALLDRFDIQRCLVLGWSLGGILAIELALKLPARVSGLILIATAARPVRSHPPVSGQDLFYTGLASILNWLRPSWQWNIDNFSKRSLYRYLLQQHTPTAYRYLALEGMAAYLQTSGAARRAMNLALQSGYDRSGDLPQIQCPSLVLSGADDRHITPQSSLETAQLIEDCEWLSYPNVAHLFPWEIPERVLADIDSWLTRHPQVLGSDRPSSIVRPEGFPSS